MIPLTTQEAFDSAVAFVRLAMAITLDDKKSVDAVAALSCGYAFAGMMQRVRQLPAQMRGKEDYASILYRLAVAAQRHADDYDNGGPLANAETRANFRLHATRLSVYMKLIMKELGLDEEAIS